MTYLMIQSALLMAIAYIIGCILGCLLHRWFSVPVVTPVAQEESKPQAIAEPMVSEPVVEAKPVEAKPAEVETVALVEDKPKKEKPKKKAKAKTKEKKKDKPKEKAKTKAKPKAKPKAKAKAAIRGKNDDLKLIKGIGRQNEAKLNALKINSFAQIADWKAKDQREIGERLSFGGRIQREKWVSQAKRLAAGKQTEFSKRVLKGEVHSSLGKGKK